MQICNNTLMILKWMSTINGGIKVDPGNKLYSKSDIGSMCAVVEVDETFPCAFVTSNLQKFLATVSLFDEPEFEFDDECVRVSSINGKNRMKFYQSQPSVVNQNNKIPRPQTDISLQLHLKSEDLQKIFKAASVMNVADICIRAYGGIITISSLNKNETTTDMMEIIIGECDPELEVTYFFKRSYLKLLTEFSYNVEIYSSGLSKFSATDSPFKQFDIYVVTQVNNKD